MRAMIAEGATGWTRLDDDGCETGCAAATSSTPALRRRRGRAGRPRQREQPVRAGLPPRAREGGDPDRCARAARLHGARRPVRRGLPGRARRAGRGRRCPEIRIDTRRRRRRERAVGDRRAARRRAARCSTCAPATRATAAAAATRTGSAARGCGSRPSAACTWTAPRGRSAASGCSSGRGTSSSTSSASATAWSTPRRSPRRCGRAPARRALNNVRHFIHSLRDKLEPDRPKRAPSSFIVAVQGGYAIDRRRVQIDADEFEEAAKKGIDAARRGRARPRREAELAKALELYRGDFLSDEPYAEWAYAERDRLRGLTTQCLRAARHDPRQARRHRRRGRACWSSSPSSSRTTPRSTASC